LALFLYKRTGIGETSMHKQQRDFFDENRVFWVKLKILMLAVAAFCFFTVSGSAHGEGLSLQVVKAPLGNVLRDLSQQTGITFVYDKAWADLPITAQFRNIALEPALKRILSNLNHAIIYSTDGTVMIRIYGTVAYEKDSSTGSDRVRSFAEKNAAGRPEGLNPRDDADVTRTDDDEKQEESGATLREAPEGAEAAEAILQPVENAEETSESGETPQENSDSGEIGKGGTPKADETGQEDQTPPAEEDTKEDG
jgi:hypothetical protein